jgi:carbonic anhydrase/acetyltransferase-like protein (isoleucine patch superfamily)
MGAIVLTGARIGSNSLVGAGALVTEGKEFPDNSLIVGAPARVLRRLDAAAIAEVAGAYEHYVAHSRRYARGLKRLP